MLKIRHIFAYIHIQPTKNKNYPHMGSLEIANDRMFLGAWHGGVVTKEMTMKAYETLVANSTFGHKKQHECASN